MDKKYFAFISYKREDEEWAKWLQHKLEHYKLPSNLNGRTDLPKEIRPIFKDTSELNPGNLPQQIHDALEQSKHLIVICSPRSAKSEWVNKEVETFMEMGRTDKIIPFIIDGKAFAKNPDEECFPKAIRDLPSEQEILGANIGEMGRDAAAVKVVAQMFGLKFDELWQRHERERRKKKNRTILSIVAFALIAVVVVGWIKYQDKQIKRENWDKMENQSKLIAKKANDLTDSGDSYTARRLLLEVLPNDLNNPDKPYTPEAEGALRLASTRNTAIIKTNHDILHSVSCSSDGHRMVTASVDGAVIIWDTDNGKPIWEGEEQYGEPFSACFSPDSRRVIAETFSFGEHTTWIWDSESGELLLKLDNTSDADFSPDSKRVVSISTDTVTVWDVETGMRLQTFDKEVFSVAYCPDGKRFISEIPGFSLMIWDTETGRTLKTLEGHNNVITSFEFSQDESQIVTTSSDSTIKIWNGHTGKLLHTLHDPNNPVNHASFSPDGQRIVSAHDDGSVKIWDIRTETLIQTLKGHTDIVTCSEYHPNGKQIVSASWDGTIRIWDLDAPEPIMTTKNDNDDIYDHYTNYSPDGNRIVTSDWNIIKIVDATTGQVLHSIDGHRDNVNSVVFNSDGTLIASTSAKWDATVRIWDVQTGEQLHELNEGANVFNFANFSPDNKYIVTTSDDGKVKIWDVDTKQVTHTLDGHTGIVNYASFSPDGQYVVSASSDGTAKVWDTKTGGLVQSFKKDKYVVKYAAFSPDGQSITTITADDITKIWPFPPLQELIDQTRERFKGNPLTPEERHQYYLE